MTSTHLLPHFPLAAEVPADVRVAPVAARWLVNGEIRAWTGPTEAVRSPVLVDAGAGLEQAVLGTLPSMGAAESKAALDAATAAWGGGLGVWPQMSVAERVRCFEAFLPKMRAKRDEVSKLLMWEIGKTLADSRKEFDRTVAYVEDTIEALKELDRTSSRFVLQEGFIAQIRRSPLGVVLCMGPFNYPLNETFTTLVPAMIMGNTVILKSPKLGVLLWDPLLEAFAESFPPGVVNTVHGDGRTVVGPLIESGQIDVLAFIGSARVGSLLKHQHPRPNRLRAVLGLEAKNAAIVLPDADLGETVKECVAGALSFNGQRCTAIKIVFVHASIADAFAERFAAAVSSLRAGMPWEDGVSLTPLPEPGKPAWLTELVEDAKAGGARVINAGGGTIDETFFAPAVLYPATTSMKVCTVEQFGPVTPIVAYSDVREVIDWFVASSVGQQASIFGRDAHALSRLIDPLVTQVCRVNLNSQCQRGPDTFPFTGRKDSAESTLSVSDALRAFSIRSLVAAKATDQNERIISEIVAGRTSRFLTTDFIF
ncbi:NADP-dependent glyceraldehyde-3-phosphate dehydrogenase [Myxococcota bacterium]|nr:NADP-dependent glyceraldehyde-3-phosphate dehydrogenase [Myxococcota bacterium]